MRPYLMATTLPKERERGMIRLLVVDNNAEFLEVFVRLLEWSPDIEVVAQAASLAEARDKLSGVDVAIIDRGLPDGDGLKLISELREASLGAAVLVMSATVEQTHPEQALEAGADGILDNIAPPEETISAIRRVGGVAGEH
jgi:DNA-binding NarL/FixJ family response regulator